MKLRCPKKARDHVGLAAALVKEIGCVFVCVLDGNAILGASNKERCCCWKEYSTIIVVAGLKALIYCCTVKILAMVWSGFWGFG